MDEYIGTRIRQRRRLYGMTQSELSKETGISDKQISRYEKGTASPPINNLMAIAKALHCPVSYLLGEEYDENCYKLTELNEKSPETVYRLIFNKEFKSVVGILSKENVTYTDKLVCKDIIGKIIDNFWR